MNKTRLPVSYEHIVLAQEKVLEGLKKRMVKHGELSFVSTHEALGVLTEEFFEVTEAVKSGDLREFAQEMLDVAVCAIFSIASLGAYLDEASSKSAKHTAVDRVECSCGEIYANERYLQKHIKKSA